MKTSGFPISTVNQESMDLPNIKRFIVVFDFKR